MRKAEALQRLPLIRVINLGERVVTTGPILSLLSSLSSLFFSPACSCAGTEYYGFVDLLLPRMLSSRHLNFYLDHFSFEIFFLDRIRFTLTFRLV